MSESGNRFVPSEPAWVRLNETATDYPERSCLHQMVEEQARLAPEAAAVLHRDASVTYGQINASANRLAHRLLELGVEVETRVGVCLRSSVERVIAVLGILKAGCAYLPLDPDYPEKRLRYMLDDARVPVLVTLESLTAELPHSGTHAVLLDADGRAIERCPDTNPVTGVDPENVAYVIYTSGSTGTPKGIAVRHTGVLNNLVDLARRFGMGERDRVLAISSLSFDMSVFEILGTLVSGGAIVMPEELRTKDPEHWAELVRRHRVSVWNSAPALLEMYVTYVESRPDLRPDSLRVALLGGDWIPVSLPDRLRRLANGAPAVQVVSLGGATEASIHSTIYPVGEVDPDWVSIPYGRPMANQRAYILDADLEPAAVGEPGELHLGGKGLARGYLGRPAATAEKFIPDPFSGERGARLYKTGDLARYLPSGEIELLGRIDFQVKIRGHRIELREIEAKLNDHPDVVDAVVAGHDDGSGGRRLVAYVVPAEVGSRDDGAAEHGQGEDIVAHWEEVYEETYRGTTERAAGREFAGWVSSFTGEPFAEEELAEIVDRTVERILGLNPDRVLEIGCGTGLLLFDLAPRCARYDASDISSAALESIRWRLRRGGTDLSHVTLTRRPAHDFEGVPPGAYDTVIINSVVQHFPDVHYLLRVLEGAVDALGPGGSIFVGDVRNLPLLHAFHTAIELQHAPDSLSLERLRERVERRVRQEKELWVDPRCFAAAAASIRGIRSADNLLRRARNRNEMSLFHYDVILRTANGSGELASPESAERFAGDGSVEGIRERILESGSDPVSFVDVEDSRLAGVLKVSRLLRDGADAGTVGALVGLDGKDADRGVDPADLWALADELGGVVEVRWPRSGRPGHFDAVFRKTGVPAAWSREGGSEVGSEAGDAAGLTAPSVAAGGDAEPAHWEALANSPMQTDRAAELVPRLQRALAATLPDFMIPSEFMLLERMPLGPNGKVDRRALPAPTPQRREVSVEFVPPQTAIEEVVGGIWSAVLEIDPLGTHDDFFELGGHSLTATRIVARINETFSTSVPLRILFENANVAAFSACLQKQAAEEGIDLDEIARVFLEVAEMSDEEVSQALARADDDARAP